jgi:hypothetical protein
VPLAGDGEGVSLYGANTMVHVRRTVALVTIFGGGFPQEKRTRLAGSDAAHDRSAAGVRRLTDSPLLDERPARGFPFPSLTEHGRPLAEAVEGRM